jgi:hypothetical protein
LWIKLDERLPSCRIDRVDSHAMASTSKADIHPIRLAYQPPVSSTFLSEQTNHQQPASSIFLSQQISISHQPNEQADHPRAPTRG